MAKISIEELSEMVKSKLAEKGISENDINQEMIKVITEKIKGIANEDYKDKVPTEPEIISPEDTVNVDISSQNMPTSTPGVIPDSITQTTVSNTSSEDIARREGEILEKERNINNREEKLKMKEEELERRSNDLKYKPEMPEVLEKIGPEKLFVFDMSKLSAGSENLTKLPMKLMNDPEKTTTMRDLWLEKAKKKSEVYVVKFEKVGEIEFNPLEGTSTLITIKDAQGDKELSDFQNGNNSEQTSQTNMVDIIEPIKDVSQPLSNDMMLKVDNNVDLENLIKKHIELAMAQKQQNA